MNTYHDLRSVRAWLNQMYPLVPILLQRNAQHTKKSYFFLQDAQEKFEDTGRGFTSINRTVNIHLVTEGMTFDNPGSDDAYWKTRQVCDFLRDKLLQDRVIPQFLFNREWYPPICWTKHLGGPMSAGTIQLACTTIDAYDKESLLSDFQTVTLQNNDHLFVTLTNWPLGRPLHKSFVLYLQTAPNVWQAIKNIPTAYIQDGSTTVEVTSLTPLFPTQNPPSTSKQWLGYLKVDTVNASMTEAILIDDAFHGYVNVTFRSRRPAPRQPAAPINTVATHTS